MNEENLLNALDTLQRAVQALLHRQDMLDNKIDQVKEESDSKYDELHETIFDEVLSPAKEAFEEFEYNGKLNDFTEKYSEKIDPYIEHTKLINGKDYDVYKDLFDKVSEDPENEESIVESTLANIKDHFERIKQFVESGKLNTPEEVVEAVEDVIEGEEPEVTVTEEVTVEAEPEEEEEPVEEDLNDKEEDVIDVDEDEFTAELEEYMKKQ